MTTSLSAKPQLPVTLSGFTQALRIVGIDLRYNARAQRIELRPSGGRWQAKTKLEEARLRTDIAAAVSNTSKPAGKPWWVSTDKWNVYRDSYCASRQVDPFKTDYLDRLTPSPPTGLLDTWLGDLWDFDTPEELVSWVGRYLFLGIVQRTLEPGCLIRETPVLIGPHGVGKSSALRAIVPPDWEFLGFSDGVNLAASPKVLLEGTQGRVLVEASEMVGLKRRADLEQMKAWLTRRDDGFVRLSYRQDPEPALRRFVVVGTSNEGTLPQDAAALARFVAIEIDASMGHRAKTQPETYIDGIRDLAFSEALYLYQQGHRCNLPETLFALRERNNQRYVYTDLVLEDVLSDPGVLPHCGRTRLRDIVPKIRTRTRQHISHQVLAAHLAAIGWSKDRQSKARYWVKECSDPSRHDGSDGVT